MPISPPVHANADESYNGGTAHAWPVTTPGDVAVLFAGARAAGAIPDISIDDDAGFPWVEITDGSESTLAGDDRQVKVFRRTLTGAETGTFTLTNTGNPGVPAPQSSVFMIFSGAVPDVLDVLYSSASHYDDDGQGNELNLIPFPNITTVTDGACLIACQLTTGAGDVNAIAPPTGFTIPAGGSIMQNHRNAGMAYKIEPTAGFIAVPDWNNTGNANTADNSGIIVALRPKVGAPVLSDPTDEVNSAGNPATEADISVTSDTAGATLSYVITDSQTTPTPAQIIAGQDHTGAAALGASSVTSQSGVNSAQVGGLPTYTQMYAHFVSEPSPTQADNSNAVSGDGFVTEGLDPVFTQHPTQTSAPGNSTFSFSANAIDVNTSPQPMDHWARIYLNSAGSPSDQDIKDGTGAVTGISGDGARLDQASGSLEDWSISGLTPGTEYRVEYLIESSAGDNARGNVLVFTTQADAGPVITSVNGGAPVANRNSNVAIVGTGFGAVQGTVRYNTVAIGVILEWTDTLVRVEWPDVPYAAGHEGTRLETPYTLVLVTAASSEAESTISTAPEQTAMFGVISPTLADPSIFTNDVYPAGSEAYGRFSGGAPNGPIDDPGFANSFDRDASGRLTGQIYGLVKGSTLDYKIYDNALNVWSDDAEDVFVPTDEQFITNVNGNDDLQNDQDDNVVNGQALGSATAVTVSDGVKTVAGTNVRPSANSVLFDLSDVRAGADSTHIKYTLDAVVALSGPALSLNAGQWYPITWNGAVARVMILHFQPTPDDTWSEYWDAWVDIDDDPGPEFIVPNIERLAAQWRNIPSLNAYPVSRGGIRLYPEDGNAYVDTLVVEPTPVAPYVAIPNVGDGDQVEFDLLSSPGGYAVEVLTDGTFRVVTGGDLTQQSVTMWRYDAVSETWSSNDTTYTELTPEITGGTAVPGATTGAVSDVQANKPLGLLHGQVRTAAAAAPSAAEIIAGTGAEGTGSENTPNIFPQPTNVPQVAQLLEDTDYTFYVTFEDEAGNTSAVLDFDFTTEGTAIDAPIFSGTVPSSIINQGSTGTYDLRPFFTTGGPVDIYTLTGNPLPPGLTLNSAGLITGTVPVGAQPGPYPGIVVTGTNAAGEANTNAFSITVTEVVVVNPPVWTNVPNQMGILDAAGSLDLSTYVVAGGDAESYGAISTLPAGLTIESSTGLISGIYERVQNLTNVRVYAQNSGGLSEVIIGGWNVRSLQAPVSIDPLRDREEKTFIDIEPINLNNYFAGADTYSADALPGGVNLVDNIISGTPSALAALTTEITATNADGEATDTFSWIVRSQAYIEGVGSLTIELPNGVTTIQRNDAAIMDWLTQFDVIDDDGSVKGLASNDWNDVGSVGAGSYPVQFSGVSTLGAPVEATRSVRIYLFGEVPVAQNIFTSMGRGMSPNFRRK